MLTHLWLLGDTTERLERVIQLRLIHTLLQVPNEQICANVNFLRVVARSTDSYRLPVQLYLIHDFDSIICILLGKELAKTEALMCS